MADDNEIVENDSSKFSPLFSVHLDCLPGYGPSIEAVLSENDINMVSWEDVDTSIYVFDDYFDTKEEADSKLAILTAILDKQISGEGWMGSVQRIDGQDWRLYWKRFFHTERVSEHIIVKPIWEICEANPNDCVIDIDPGMSFGTGQHPTTRACLSFIDKLSNENTGLSFLDLGCGSAILSIAAAKLKYSKITAIDCDSDAVEIANNNIAMNGVSGDINCFASDIADFVIYADGQCYDVVAANVFSHILQQNADVISGLVNKDGWLILAGILTTQYRQVCDVYKMNGFESVTYIVDGDWQSGLFHHITM